jgi:hypothetical protein
MVRRTAFAVIMILLAGVLWTPVPYAHENYQRKPRVKIVMFSTPDIVSQYAGHAADINKAYARKHGYAFEHHIQHIPATDRKRMVWKMVEVLLQSLNDADAVVYIDSDAVFNDHTKSLEWLFNVPGEILGCSDAPNGDSYINTGTLFVKNTKLARSLLERWWSLRDDPAYCSFPYEQKALSDLARNAAPGSIVALPATEFNSIWSELRSGRRDTFVLHFMAFPAAERAAEFETIKRRLGMS